MVADVALCTDAVVVGGRAPTYRKETMCISQCVYCNVQTHVFQS